MMLRSLGPEAFWWILEWAKQCRKKTKSDGVTNHPKLFEVSVFGPRLKVQVVQVAVISAGNQLPREVEHFLPWQYPRFSY